MKSRVPEISFSAGSSPGNENALTLKIQLIHHISNLGISQLSEHIAISIRKPFSLNYIVKHFSKGQLSQTLESFTFFSISQSHHQKKKTYKEMENVETFNEYETTTILYIMTGMF